MACNENKKGAETTTAQEVATVDAEAATYEVDTAASAIMWEGAKPTGKHNGTIMLKNGKIMMEGDAVTAGKFTIDMTSIVNEDMEGEKKTNLENHLKGTVEGKEGDFFNVNEYPEATFEITGVAEKDGTAMVSGNLTIKGKTNNVTFPATVARDGDSVTIVSGAYSIDRTKWGVNYGSKSIFDNLGDRFISDDINLTLKVKATK